MLTPRQERFCQEFIKDGNGTQSAIRAGYSKRTANEQSVRLLANISVKNRIRELSEILQNDRIMDAREMQEHLTSIIRQESEEEVIVVEGCGDGVSEAVTKKKKPSQSDRIKAIQLLARMQGALDNSATLEVIVPVFDGEDDLEA